MRLGGRLALLAFCVVPASALAEPIVVTSTTLTTSGRFDCRASISCTGEGTNSVTFFNGTKSATLTFTGLQQTFDVTNQAQPVTLGSFELSQSDGFIFPNHANSPGLPVVRFFFTAHQDAPSSATSHPLWEFGPGGRTVLPLEIGQSYFSLGLDRSVFGYGQIVYSLRPFPFTINPGATSFTAEVAAIPEPGTMVLLGTGLLVVASALRRRSFSALSSRLVTGFRYAGSELRRFKDSAIHGISGW